LSAQKKKSSPFSFLCSFHFFVAVTWFFAVVFLVYCVRPAQIVSFELHAGAEDTSFVVVSKTVTRRVLRRNPRVPRVVSKKVEGCAILYFVPEFVLLDTFFRAGAANFPTFERCILSSLFCKWKNATAVFFSPSSPPLGNLNGLFLI
jgi:hypothetical protein